MGRQRLEWTFERLRRLAYQRHKAQALFRGEAYEISEDYWNEIWTEDRFRQRGMRAENICLSRIDHTQPWRQGNLCLLLRQQQLEINNKVIHEIDASHIYKKALWRDYV